MIRLKKVKNYIFTRQNEFNNDFASIFTNSLKAKIFYLISFYYNVSNKHNNFRQKITANAMKRKVAKEVEWKRKQKEYNSLIAEVTAS